MAKKVHCGMKLGKVLCPIVGECDETILITIYNVKAEEISEMAKFQAKQASNWIKAATLAEDELMFDLVDASHRTKQDFNDASKEVEVLVFDAIVHQEDGSTTRGKFELADTDARAAVFAQVGEAKDAGEALEEMYLVTDVFERKVGKKTIPQTYYRFSDVPQTIYDENKKAFDAQKLAS